MKPIYMSAALAVEISDQLVACKDSVKLKQLDTRLSSFAGFFNLAFTIGYSFIEGSNNDLYASIMKLVSFSSLPCSDLGFYTGQLIANLLEAKSPSEVFYNSVPSSK